MQSCRTQLPAVHAGVSSVDSVPLMTLGRQGFACLRSFFMTVTRKEKTKSQRTLAVSYVVGHRVEKGLFSYLRFCRYVQVSLDVS